MWLASNWSPIHLLPPPLSLLPQPQEHFAKEKSPWLVDAQAYLCQIVYSYWETKAQASLSQFDVQRWGCLDGVHHHWEETIFFGILCWSIFYGAGWTLEEHGSTVVPSCVKSKYGLIKRQPGGCVPWQDLTLWPKWQTYLEACSPSICFVRRRPPPASISQHLPPASILNHCWDDHEHPSLIFPASVKCHHPEPGTSSKYGSRFKNTPKCESPDTLQLVPLGSLCNQWGETGYKPSGVFQKFP